MPSRYARILSVVGARPNFMKLAPLARALGARPEASHFVVHTGQHYDLEMSDAFFRDLGVRVPDVNLEVGSGTHAQQTAAIMQRFEPVILEQQPEIVLVYGDVNSTVAAALVAAKLGVPVGHVEAGLRSGDWSMPEEVNRVVTDRISEFLFAPCRDAVRNLQAEGVAANRIHMVGNIMIDSLAASLAGAKETRGPEKYGVAGMPYVVVTLHRPSNVDAPATLRGLLEALEELSRERPVVFPVHPRTRAKMQELGWEPRRNGSLRLMQPLPYLEMLSLVCSSHLVITDSGGLQEETTYLGIPCLTIRPNTERPITCTKGTNLLVRPEKAAVLQAVEHAITQPRSVPAIERWDGHTAGRIVSVLCDGAGFD